jgi:hypothetical protein
MGHRDGEIYLRDCLIHSLPVLLTDNPMFGLEVILQMAILLLLLASLASFIISLIYIFSPTTYSRLEEILSIDLGSVATILSVLEGEINFIEDWIYERRFFFGSVLAILSLNNCINLAKLGLNFTI